VHSPPASLKIKAINDIVCALLNSSWYFNGRLVFANANALLMATVCGGTGNGPSAAANSCQPAAQLID
jgi:hypothetical protein